MCLLEAGASGVPILATRVGLCRELINSDTGEFLKNTKPNHISKKIDYVLKNRDISVQRAMNLRKIIENDWVYSSRDYEIINVLEKGNK